MCREFHHPCGRSTLNSVTSTESAPSGTSPLSARVVAPAEASAAPVDGVSWRAAAVADIEAITEVVQAADRVDHPHFLTTREEIAEEFESSHLHAVRDTLVGIAPDGSMVAYGIVALSPGQETLVRSIVFGAVRPEWRGRGIGRALLDWQEQRALQQLATSQKRLPGWIMTYAEESSHSAIRLLQRAGFGIARYYSELQRPLNEPLPSVDPPAGIVIEPLAEADVEVLRLARNDSFRDHFGSQPVLAEQWQQFMRRSTTRHDLSFIARSDDGRIAGFVVTTVNPDDWESQGFSHAYIDLVGVTRAFRGRGIAPALLAHTLAALTDEGLEGAVLDVDTDSPTGAHSLYERVGFRESSRSINFTKVF